MSIIPPLPITTGPYSGLGQFIEFPAFSISGTITVPGVTTHLATKTRRNENEETPIVIFFPCFGFCRGGGGVGGGFGVLFNIGPAPGIYYPPDLPPFVIGPNGITIPNPPDVPPKPTEPPGKPEQPSDQPSQALLSDMYWQHLQSNSDIQFSAMALRPAKAL
ncbi:hypothetical protein NX059_010261 [Plenodomus lindquistii]|nr:hypothetical protein NX059_010261 [Plenodomus lindquistii]